MEIILGSQSPRRREIISLFPLPVQFQSSDFDERSIPFQGDPEEYVWQIAKGKALALEPHFPHTPILTADTTVFHGGKVYGKPADFEKAAAMILELSGHTHTVYTALTLLEKGNLHRDISATQVTLRPLTPQQAHTYVRAIQALDKAGSYAIQGIGGALVESIEGCYYNVMGLPLQGLDRCLKHLGTDLWQTLQEPHEQEISH